MIWNRRKPDNPETAETGAESGESPQLSQVEGVPNDMSSVAIGGAFPASSSVPAASNFASAIPALAETGRRAGHAPGARWRRCRLQLPGQRYRRAMISFMYRMVHNSAIAEELSQEVFLRVYRSRASYAADAKFTTWLYRIATNLAVNHARDNNTSARR